MVISFCLGKTYSRGKIIQEFFIIFKTYKSYIMKSWKRALSPLATLESLYNKSAWGSLTQGYSFVTLNKGSVKQKESTAKEAAAPYQSPGTQLEGMVFWNPVYLTLLNLLLLSQKIPTAKESSRLPISQLPQSCCTFPLSISQFFLSLHTSLPSSHVSDLSALSKSHLHPTASHSRAGAQWTGSLLGCWLCPVKTQSPKPQ